ncbi:major capsid protein [Blackfly microvirus SF02]|uniref:Major capsid protein n=1 Tax=Blackfly microvirus SF02 TaxID=2576452 RepID=A0A4P8PLD8_9VIRU|nr:major capsid protein [Blackfly microvirus SF02]
MRSVMTHQFSRVPSAEIPRSSFDRSHGHKTTFDAGYLVPIYVDEALPGDTFQCKLTAFARLATPIVPVMDNMFMDTFFFSVPVRLIWDNWQKFNGEQKNPGDSIDFLVPQITSPAGGFTEGSLEDYFGIPTKVANLPVSAFWHRAYNLIYNEWFRDQNMQTSRPVPTDDGPDALGNYMLLKRGKRHDYFTSCLPWPQKGPGVQIPLGTVAPVRGLFATMDGNSTNARSLTAKIGADGVFLNSAANVNMGLYANSSAPDHLYADLSTATAATINSLRQAFQIQKIYERDARGGTRYTELIKSHFGVTSPDARLQRPEYLGGGSTPVNISPVPQTAPTTAAGETPQGNLAAYGTVGLNQHAFTSSFTEHCIIIGLCSVRADLTYQQGLNRMFSRRTRFDFYLPALSHIGEQAVYQKEIYATGATAQDNIVFGYQERFAEYRYKPSIITGLFRSNAAQPLDTWHLSQKFTAAPVLSTAFITEDPPIDRVIAVPSEPHFLFDSYIQLRCTRPMPVYGVPGLIDHF